MPQPDHAVPPIEPVLDWHLTRWQGDTRDNLLFIWMTDDTLQRYVRAWLEAREITEPTLEQKYVAMSQCRKLSYWQGCTDPDVHITNYEQIRAQAQGMGHKYG